MAVDNVGLKEPLATLPNGVKDTRDGNTVTRRVGKKILDGDAELYGPSYVPNIGWAISIKSPDIVMSPADGEMAGFTVIHYQPLTIGLTGLESLCVQKDNILLSP